MHSLHFACVDGHAFKLHDASIASISCPLGPCMFYIVHDVVNINMLYS
jgi:hypothetical protein